ncbi:MAG: NYN domain-containing protein [Thermostichus sp. DG_1_6_bins_120]
MSPAFPTLLLVDGYNIIGAWPPLRKLARRSLMELARLRLVESLAGYVAFRGYQATVVYDSYAQPTPAHQERSPSGIDILYTAYGETADTCIERLCAQLQWNECRVRVATSDRVQQLVIQAYDAEWISAEQLWEEVQQTQQQIRRIKPKRLPSKRGIDSYLDAETLARLNRWRLSGQDPTP